MHIDKEREAAFYDIGENNTVRCGLCPHRCQIPVKASGICGVRENRDGMLFATGYGRISSVALDPIEKKPLYMFHPGKRVLSIGGYGCNMRCGFCQNYEISVEYGNIWNYTKMMQPGDILMLAGQSVPRGNIGVAYTYNEPLIGYEYVRDCAGLVHSAGLCNVIVTNGYINREPLEELLPLIDAMNIDLKGFTEGFYKTAGGSIDAVKDTISLCAGRCHIEVTTLVIPGENEADVGEIAKWLATVDPGIPLHITRFFPRYRYGDRTPTTREAIFDLRKTALKYLKNVYMGNM